MRIYKTSIALNTVVEIYFRSAKGSISVGNDDLMIFHPLLDRNYYVFEEIKKVSVRYFFHFFLILTWNDGSRLGLSTPWAGKLKKLIKPRLVNMKSPRRAGGTA